jgi:hypothetical protein
MGYRRAHDVERRIDVRLDGRVEVLGRDIQDRFMRLLASGVADQDVEAAKTRNRVLDKLFAKPAFWMSATTSRASSSSVG